MLAVFSAWNTASAMSDDDGNWIIFFREAEPSGFVITVNQAVSSGSRAPQHAACHELRFRFAPDQRAERGMPNAGAQQLYYAVEDELDGILSNGVGEVVARRTGQNMRSVWFCARDGAGVKAHALIRTDRTISIDLRPVLLAEITALHPTPLEGHLARDNDVVYSLAQNGDDHSIARKIDHLIYDTDNHGAIEARLRKLGFAIEPDRRSDAILFFRVSPIDIDAIQNDTRLLMNLCAEFGCDYDGWGAPVMTSK
jgi:regulator of RNase E activity RraB